MVSRNFKKGDTSYGSWSYPVKMVDTSSFQIEFSEGYILPDGSVDKTTKPTPSIFTGDKTSWRSESAQQG
jgi:hypothetical protein